jgi:hypothetical protein
MPARVFRQRPGIALMDSKQAGDMPLEDYPRFGIGIDVVDLIKNWESLRRKRANRIATAAELLDEYRSEE